jgi:two-component system, cell cycle response regulator CpdR
VTPRLKTLLSPINILYVEDNDDIREMVLELIAGEHRRIVACANAEDAWLLLRREAFDVLVTDVSLPGGSGAELASRWLEGDAARWVILFSGFEFKSGPSSLGANVRAIPKEDIEQLERVLDEIGRQLRPRPPGNC